MSQSSLRLVEGSSMDKDRSKALDAALSQIERAFGKGSIMRLGKGQKPVEIETVPSGPRGRDLRPGIVRQDYARPVHRGRGAEEGRGLRLHRRGARARPDLRTK